MNASHLNSNLNVSMLVSGLCLGLALSATAAGKTVPLNDAPAAVQKTIADQLKGGKLRALSLEVDDGKMEYEAELIVEGREKTVVIDPSGQVLETEAVMELSALPDAVRVTLTREAGTGSILRVEEVARAGIVSYEALVKEAGKKSREVAVGADGKLMAPKK